MKQKKNKAVFGSEFSCKESSGLDDTTFLDIEMPEINLCKHNDYCIVRVIKKKPNCSEHYSEKCGQPKRFYDKYRR